MLSKAASTSAIEVGALPDITAFRALADLLPEPLLLVRSDGIIEAVNRAGISAFDWSGDELVGHELSTIVSTPRDQLVEYLRHCLATSQLLFGALTLRLRDGTDAPCRAEGAAFRPSLDSRQRFILLRLLRRESATVRFVELTQKLGDLNAEVVRRQRAESAAVAAVRDLREQENQLLELANSIPNLAWMARPDGSIYWFNDQWYTFTGKTPTEMEGEGWQSVHDPAVLPQVVERWRHCVATGSSFEMVYPLRDSNGQYRRFLTRVNPVRDSQGRVVRWFGTNTDVEDERRATEANVLLREREALARREAELQKRLLYALFQQAPTLIAVLRGPEHVIELANPPMCQACDRVEAELRERPIFDCIPELRDQTFRLLLEEAYRTGHPRVARETLMRFRRGHAASETLYLDLVYSPFRNLHGEIEGTFVIASDVTEQVLARQQMDRLRGEAEAANRAKDEFLAMLGHELRNPLSPILTALQLMKLRGDEGSDRERTVIERQVSHLTRLVDDLLDVSRIARGKVELKREVVEMADIVAEAIEMASPLLEQRRHTLTVQVPRHDLAVEGDATRLSQVVANLLTNAAKYTATRGRVTMTAEAERGEVVLRVRDTGIGIASEVLPRVFDPFIQERQAIDRAQGGLGLGLTIVRSLVERHGGSVSAHSDGPDRGSEFVVRLPRVPSASRVADQRPLRPPVRPTVDAVSAPLRILIVDDNQDSAEMLAAALETCGYQTCVALDAPAALRVAQDFNPGVAFLDIGLPVMDGYELGERLRRLTGLEGIRLIALTGYGQDSDRQRTIEAGFHHHLVKPVDLDTVQTVLAGVM